MLLMSTVTQMGMSAKKGKRFLKIHVYCYRPNSYKFWPMSVLLFC